MKRKFEAKVFKDGFFPSRPWRAKLVEVGQQEGHGFTLTTEGYRTLTRLKAVLADVVLADVEVVRCKEMDR